MLIERLISGEEVVRTDDRRVPPNIAAAEITALDHGDIGDPVIAGEIPCGGEAVAAAADDDDVVFGLRVRLPPDRFPALVAGQTLFEDPEG